MRQKLIVGNWKMHGSSTTNAALLSGIVAGLASVPDGVEVAVCPPSIYLHQVREALAATVVAWGAQDISTQAQGAFTGELSGLMLRDFDCRYVIVGHSERRAIHGETDALVAAKAEAALTSGLTPIVCLGETLQERENGVTDEVIARQLDAVLEKIGVEGLAAIVVAYEPVWAIGTGRTATPDQAQAVHSFIRNRVAQHDARVANGLQVVYGGSVKPQNARELFAMPDIDGGLIGGAALQAADFLAIALAARPAVFCD